MWFCEYYCLVEMLSCHLCPSCLQARSDYEATVTYINSLQHDVFLRQLPQAITNLRITVQAMVGVVNTALKSFLEMQLTLTAGSSSEKVTGSTLPRSHAQTFSVSWSHSQITALIAPTLRYLPTSSMFLFPLPLSSQPHPLSSLTLWSTPSRSSSMECHMTLSPHPLPTSLKSLFIR